MDFFESISRYRVVIRQRPCRWRWYDDHYRDGVHRNVSHSVINDTYCHWLDSNSDSNTNSVADSDAYARTANHTFSNQH